MELTEKQKEILEQVSIFFYYLPLFFLKSHRSIRKHL